MKQSAQDIFLVDFHFLAKTLSSFSGNIYGKTNNRQYYFLADIIKSNLFFWSGVINKNNDSIWWMDICYFSLTLLYPEFGRCSSRRQIGGF